MNRPVRRLAAAVCAAVAVSLTTACGNAAVPVTAPANSGQSARQQPGEGSSPKNASTRSESTQGVSTQSTSSAPTSASTVTAPTLTMGGQTFHFPPVKVPEAEILMAQTTPQSGNVTFDKTDEAWQKAFKANIAAAGFKTVQHMPLADVYSDDTYAMTVTWMETVVTVQWVAGDASQLDAEESPEPTPPSATPSTAEEKADQIDVVFGADVNVDKVPYKFPFPAGGKLRGLKQDANGSTFVVSGYPVDVLVAFYRSNLPSYHFTVIREDTTDPWRMKFTNDDDYESSATVEGDGIRFVHALKK